jgi:aspartate/tyrosine/aromatic aminotransferase
MPTFIAPSSAAQPWILPSVHAAEEQLLNENVNHEYATIAGESIQLHQSCHLLAQHAIANCLLFGHILHFQVFLDSRTLP